MARTFVTCPVHVACQVETNGVDETHHEGQLQPRSPNSPEGRKHYTALAASPAYWETFKRWRARRKRRR